MESPQALLAAPLVESIGWALVHSIWQIALVAALFAVAQFALRRHSAALRYALGCIALGTMAMVVAATVCLVWTTLDDRFPPGSIAAAPRSVVVEPAMDPIVVPTTIHDEPETPSIPTPEPVVETPSETSPAIEASSSGSPPSAPFRRQLIDTIGEWLPWLVAGWLLGVIGFASRLACGWLGVRRLRRRGIAPVAGALEERLIRLSNRLGLDRAATLVMSTVVEVPAVIGHFRPAILLPVSLATGLSPLQIDIMLLHELAHIRRHDYLVNLIQTVIETVLFHHPAMWWVSRQVRQERENCCDDMALAVCGDRAAYAGALAAMEELRTAVYRPAVAASGGNLLTRVRRIIGRPVEGPGRRHAWLAGMLLLGIILATAIGVMGATSGNIGAEVNDEQNQSSVEQLADEGAMLDRVVAAPVQIRIDVPAAATPKEPENEKPATLVIEYSMFGDEPMGIFRLQRKTRDGAGWRVHEEHEPIVVQNGGFTKVDDLRPGVYDLARLKATKRLDRRMNLGGKTFLCDRRDVELAPGETTTVRFRRGDDARSIPGRVTGLPDDSPYTLTVAVRTAGATGDPRSDKEARLRTFDALSCWPDKPFTTAPIPPGRYTLVAVAYRPLKNPGQLGWVLPDFLGTADVTVPAEGDVTAVEIKMLPREEFEKRLKFKKSTWGKPVQEVRARLMVEQTMKNLTEGPLFILEVENSCTPLEFPIQPQGTEGMDVFLLEINGQTYHLMRTTWEWRDIYAPTGPGSEKVRHVFAFRLISEDGLVSLKHVTPPEVGRDESGISSYGLTTAVGQSLKPLKPLQPGKHSMRMAVPIYQRYGVGNMATVVQDTDGNNLYAWTPPVDFEIGELSAAAVSKDKEKTAVWGKTTTVDFVRQGGKPVKGRVTGIPTDSILGVSIRVSSANATLDAVPAEPNGDFTTAPVSPGQYTLAAAAYPPQRNLNTTGRVLPVFIGRAKVTVPAEGDVTAVEIKMMPREEFEKRLKKIKTTSESPPVIMH